MRALHHLRLIVVAPVLFAWPAGAYIFTPPENCRLAMTVQNRGCSVSQIYHCSTDKKGDQRSAVFDRDGLISVSRIDAETRWLYSWNARNGIEDMLVEQAKDHASFSTLLQAGRDNFDFWTLSSTGERLRHTGYDELTGKKRTIDGVKLEQTRFQMTTSAENGDTLIEMHGNQYISRDLGRFFGGIEELSDWTGKTKHQNDTPVEFSFPGDGDFGETVPQFDCEQTLVRIKMISKGE